MISKTVLATHPRHRPHANLINAGWREVCSGEWIHAGLSVVLEIDGLWHSYARETETRKNSPGFMSISDAMQDATQRSSGLKSAPSAIRIPVQAA